MQSPQTPKLKYVNHQLQSQTPCSFTDELDEKYVLNRVIAPWQSRAGPYVSRTLRFSVYFWSRYL